MNEKIKKLKEKMRAEMNQDKKPLLIIALGLVGMVCLLFSCGGSAEEKNESVSKPESVQTEITRQLEALLKTVDGVGKVKVFVSVDSLSENIYAVNTEETSDADGTQRTEKYVFRENGSNSDGVLIRTVMPQIRGVGVCCEGGGSSVVRQEVTKLVGAALGITNNKIWVSKMDPD